MPRRPPGVLERPGYERARFKSTTSPERELLTMARRVPSGGSGEVHDLLALEARQPESMGRIRKKR